MSHFLRVANLLQISRQMGQARDVVFVGVLSDYRQPVVVAGARDGLAADAALGHRVRLVNVLAGAKVRRECSLWIETGRYGIGLPNVREVAGDQRQLLAHPGRL